VQHSGVDGRDKRREGGGSTGGGGSLLKGAVGDNREGGGVRQRGRHAAWGWVWGFASTGGWRPDRGQAAVRVGGTTLFRQWRADTADAWAPACGGRGSEEQGAGTRGPAWRNAEWVEPWMNSSI
jgi:hypothetical protein